jgi:hypothetical protein
MTSPKDVFKEIVKATYKAHAARYRLAQALMERLKGMSSDASVFEVSGYQTYVWVPKDFKKEYRVWPYSLTSLPTGWLKDRPYAVKTPPIEVDWKTVYEQLAPKFSIKLAVMDSIKDLLNMLTAAEITTEGINPSEWSGRAIFNGMPAWYRIESDRIVITYYDETLETWTTETIAYSGEIDQCGIKNWIQMTLDSIIRGILIICPDGKQFVASYEAPLCSDLDQMVAYLRQLAEKHSYCVVFRPKSLSFIDGPLAGVSWSEESIKPWLFFSPGLGAVMTCREEIAGKIEYALATCEDKLEALYCKKESNQ